VNTSVIVYSRIHGPRLWLEFTDASLHYTEHGPCCKSTAVQLFLLTQPSFSVRENVFNNSKNVKATFLGFQKTLKILIKNIHTLLEIKV